ncbi:hypothetical protein Rcae01_01388 [Novipirellula caenicola]|uniref:Group II intron, maturase-specific domain n=1 Tax=Novipirellula caenicola TaxID=1536901 RepID=A0ABP9VP43_9BACT
MDFLVRQWWIRRTRKSIVRLKQQAARDFRYVNIRNLGWEGKAVGWHHLKPRQHTTVVYNRYWMTWGALSVAECCIDSANGSLSDA